MKKRLHTVLWCVLLQCAWGATIATDGSLGPAARTLVADNGAYTIAQDLGARSGDNLFHSFDRFGLDNSESATFTGAADIRTVISRVTGGAASQIDGVLRSTIGSADLYFINPAGVLFGPNATLDLPGAFHVSTADYIRFGMDDVFYSDPLESSVLSTAAPTAFGFLEVPQAGIEVDGAALALAEGQTLSLVGGTVEVNNGAELKAATGQVNLVSAASAGEAVWLTDNGDLDRSGLSALGTVAVKGASEVNVDGSGGGRLFVRGGQVVVEDSVLSAKTEGNDDGRGVDIAADNFQLLDGFGYMVGSRISSSTDLSGNAGSIEIIAPEIVLDGEGSKIASNSNSSSIDAGDAGFIGLQTETLTVRDGAVITTSSEGGGSGGDITINTKNITVDGQQLEASLLVYSASDGDGGKLIINATETVDILNRGQIFGFTSGSGKGSDVEIHAKNLNLIGGGIAIDTDSGSSGDAGTLEIQVEQAVTITNGGNILMSTKGSGDGGDLFINAGNLELQDGSYIAVDTVSSGNAGTVAIALQDTLNISGSTISSSTDLSGNAGSINIIGQDLVLGGRAEVSSKSTSTTLAVDDTGDAGTITIDMTGDIDLSDGSTITTAAEQSNAGTIDIQAEGQIRVSDSSVSIQAGQGVVGGILRPSELFKLDHPAEEQLRAFSEPVEPSGLTFERPQLQIFSLGSIRISNSNIDARAGLLAGTVSLAAQDAILIDDSLITLEVDQRSMDLSNIWNAAEFENNTDGFKQAFSALFSELTLQAQTGILISNSQLTTNAGIAARESGDIAPDVINGFGGSINLLVPMTFPTRISLLNSTLEARSYAMGGNVVIDPYYYIVNQSDVITNAAFVGGNYTINAAYFLQSLDSVVDLSGQQSGNFVSNAVEVDLGAALQKLQADFLNLDRFVQASCDLYYAESQSSFIVQPARLDGLSVEDYMPSAPPASLYELEYISEIADEGNEAYWILPG